MRRIGRALGIAVFALWLSSCASTDDWQTPHLSIVSATVTSADVFNAQFRIRLHVDNPNPRNLPVKQLTYEVYLEGDLFADGASDAPFVVPANGTKEFDLTLSTQFLSSIGRLMARLNGTNRNQIEYVIKGTVVVDVPFSPKIKFSEGGTVNLNAR
jgi:LEA14-like dessication related protein